jgi:AcrR family transcriptional regulator
VLVTTAATAPTTSPKSDIVHAATKLFSEKGYAQTTMSDIARASGLQQSSLYYWFRNKEQLLQETLLVTRAPLKFIAEVGAGSGSPAVKLYRLLRRPSEIARISAQAAQFDDASIALRVTRPRPE